MAKKDEISIKSFTKQIVNLNPADFAEICDQGAKVLECFGLDPSFFLDSYSIKPEVSCVLVHYLPLYLWLLKEIDDTFIAQAAAIDLAQQEEYEAVKEKFLSIINQLPTEIAHLLLEYYQKKQDDLNALKGRKSKKSSASKSPQEIAPIVIPTEDEVMAALEEIINKAKNLLEEKEAGNILDGKIDFVFAQTQESFQNELKRFFSDSVLPQVLIVISEQFRDWALQKDQYLDERARSLIMYLAQGYIEQDFEAEMDMKDLIQVKPQVTFAYSERKKQDTSLPLLLTTTIFQNLKTAFMNHPEEQSVFTSLNQLDAKKILGDYLKKYIEVQEMSNRIAFAVRSLSNVDTAQLRNQKPNPKGGAQ